jgi:hypothetical protein
MLPVYVNITISLLVVTSCAMLLRYQSFRIGSLKEEATSFSETLIDLLTFQATSKKTLLWILTIVNDPIFCGRFSNVEPTNIKGMWNECYVIGGHFRHVLLILLRELSAEGAYAYASVYIPSISHILDSSWAARSTPKAEGGPELRYSPTLTSSRQTR